MSPRHVFLSIKDMNWVYFNVLTFGMTEHHESDYSYETEVERENALSEAITVLKKIAVAAMVYVEAYDRAERTNWSSYVGLFFHVYPYTNVKACQMHIVDISEVGPTFHSLSTRNMKLEDCLAVITDEWREAKKRVTEMQKRMHISPSSAVQTTQKKSIADVPVEESESRRRRDLYGLQNRASHRRPVVRMMGKESWRQQFRQFPLDKSGNPTDACQRQVGLVQQQVARILGCK